MTITAVSFDAAGTLIHFARPVGEVYAEVGKRYGLTGEAAAIAARLAAALREAPPLVPAAAVDADAFEYAWWQEVAARAYGCGPDDMRLQACFAELFHYYAKVEAWRVHDALPWLLQQLQADGYRLAICSNFDGRLFAILDGLGLAVYFDTVLIPRIAGYAKPDVGMFGALVQTLKVVPQQVLHVGDHAVADIRAAATMGLHALQWSLPPSADVNRACAVLRAALHPGRNGG